MVTKRDYSADAVAGAKSVLIELVHLLGEYKEHTVLIGGWVPELLLSGGSVRHVGSIDIDLAFDHRQIESSGYRMIRDLLLDRGYIQGKQPFVFYRNVEVDGKISEFRLTCFPANMPARAKDTGIREYRIYWSER